MTDHSRTMDLLKENPLFARCDEPGLELAAAGATVLELDADMKIFDRGEPASTVWVLNEGLVRVFHTDDGDGREVTVTNLLPPNTFGEMEVIAEAVGHQSGGYLESTITLQPTLLIKVPGPSFLNLIEADPKLSTELMRDICCRFCDAAQRERSLFFEVPVRLAGLLFAYADIVGKKTERGLQIQLALTQDDLARSLGVTRKSISRALTQWKQQGWVTQHKGWMVISDPEALEELCGGARMSLAYRYEPKANDEEST